MLALQYRWKPLDINGLDYLTGGLVGGRFRNTARKERATRGGTMRASWLASLDRLRAWEGVLLEMCKARHSRLTVDLFSSAVVEWMNPIYLFLISHLSCLFLLWTLSVVPFASKGRFITQTKTQLLKILDKRTYDIWQPKLYLWPISSLFYPWDRLSPTNFFSFAEMCCAAFQIIL